MSSKSKSGSENEEEFQKEQEVEKCGNLMKRGGNTKQERRTKRGLVGWMRDCS